MVDRFINEIPSLPLRKFVAMVVLIFCTLVLVGVGWTLRGIEDKEDKKHEHMVAKQAALETEEQMVRDLKLLLSCQRIEGGK